MATLNNKIISLRSLLLASSISLLGVGQSMGSIVFDVIDSDTVTITIGGNSVLNTGSSGPSNANVWGSTEGDSISTDTPSSTGFTSGGSGSYNYSDGEGGVSYELYTNGAGLVTGVELQAGFGSSSGSDLDGGTLTIDFESDHGVTGLASDLDLVTGSGTNTTLTSPFDPVSIENSFKVHTLLPRLAITTINGSHHRLLMDSDLDADGWHAWQTGDYADFQEVNATQFIGEIGASRDFGIKNFRFGLSVGHTSADQDAIFGGGAHLEGEFVIAETNYKLPETDVILSSLIYFGQYDLETDRGYSAGGEHSIGETTANSFALRLRADWKNVYVKDKVSVTPRIAYTYLTSSADAYTETGGTSPASFEEQDSKDHEFRLGVDIDYAYSAKTQMRAILELVHRETDNDDLRGNVGAINFNLPGEDTLNTWGRVGFELQHQLNDNTNVHASVFRSTEGFDANFSGALGMNISF